MSTYMGIYTSLSIDGKEVPCLSFNESISQPMAPVSVFGGATNLFESGPVEHQVEFSFHETGERMDLTGKHVLRVTRGDEETEWEVYVTRVDHALGTMGPLTTHVTATVLDGSERTRSLAPREVYTPRPEVVPPVDLRLNDLVEWDE